MNKKELVKVFALCAIAAGAAWALDSNIVGYNTAALDKEWTIMGFNFEECVTGGEVSLLEALPYTDGMTKGNGTTAADQIQIQTAGGSYEAYYLNSGFVGKTARSDLSNKWTSVVGNLPATNTFVKVGQAFWYLAANAETTPFTAAMAGQVVTTATADMPVTLKTKLIANPFPTDLPLNPGIPYADGIGMTRGNGTTAADQIQVQTAGGSYESYYLNSGFIGKTARPDLSNKWVSVVGNLEAAVSIPAARGAWYMRDGNTDFNIAIVRPFTP